MGAQRSVAYLLPGAGRVGLARGVDGLLELVQAHERGCQSAPVGDVAKDGACGLVEPLLKHAVANALQVGLVLPSHELLQSAHILCLGVRVHQLCVYLMSQQQR